MTDTNGTQRLLQKALGLIQPATKYGLAKRLEMSPSNLNKALAGRGNIGPKHAVLLAQVLDLEPLDVIAVTQFDAARSAREKEFWHRLVPRFLQALSLGLIVLAGSFGHSRPAYGNHGPGASGSDAIYIMRTRRRRAA